MADLLECLVQIRALSETARQFALLVSEASRPSFDRNSAQGLHALLDLVEGMARAEQLFATSLRLILDQQGAVLPSEAPDVTASHTSTVITSTVVEPVLSALERFTAWRTQNLEVLASCSADALSRIGIHRQRGGVTVADLVAHALARDTEQLGQLRQHLSSFAAHLPTPGDRDD